MAFSHFFIASWQNSILRYNNFMNYEEFLFDRAMEYMFKKAIKDFESFFQY